MIGRVGHNIIGRLSMTGLVVAEHDITGRGWYSGYGRRVGHDVAVYYLGYCSEYLFFHFNNYLLFNDKTHIFASINLD